VMFGMYGFWGATKYDKKKIRIHFYWLLVVSVLLSVVGYLRVITATDFCDGHNCSIDHMFHPKAGEVARAQTEGGLLGPGAEHMLDGSNLFQFSGIVPKAPQDKQHTDPVNNLLQEPTKAATGRAATGSAAVASSVGAIPPEGIPVYREPCFLDRYDKPSPFLCTETHKLSAISTIVIAVPLNIFFSFIVRSLYMKVKKGELPVVIPESERIVRARPIKIGQPVPPMAIYEAAGLDGKPVDGRYHQSGQGDSPNRMQGGHLPLHQQE